MDDATKEVLLALVGVLSLAVGGYFAWLVAKRRRK